MTAFDKTCEELRASPKRWLVTGAAGFIGSNLIETLIGLDQKVIGLDNFATGKKENLSLLRAAAAKSGSSFEFVTGDIRSSDLCREHCRDVDFVLHQAAQVSVPASIVNPMETHETNVSGFLNLLIAAKENGVQRVVYASSCSVYGDSPQLPLTEEGPCKPLSPYAASKLADELYAESICKDGSLHTVGLRYFNVFGPRQDPRGVYAAVIPLWASAMIQNKPISIYGDGSTTRDFCFIANVVQANLLAATVGLEKRHHDVVNVAVGGRTSLNDLFQMLRTMLLGHYPHLKAFQPDYRPFRAGDIRHSQADISKAGRVLGYTPSHTVEQGLKETLAWYRNQPPC